MSGQRPAASQRLPYVWGATPPEVAASYPCDLLLGPDAVRLVRAVGCGAPAPHAYRWLCQLRLAPYSYDWIDNAGRTSPRQLVAGTEDLRVGQRMMTIFDLVAFTPGRDLTVLVRPGAPTVAFGRVAVTYAAVPSPVGSRLVAVLRVEEPPGPLAGARVRALAWGDLLMMRKQLRTLAVLAERPA